MRTILLVFFLIYVTVDRNIYAQNIQYTDARKLTLIGKAMPGNSFYHRIDTALYSKIPFKVKSILTHSAGLAISFKTNSRKITAKWTITNRKAADNMTPIMHKGVDLYIKQDNKWRFAGVGHPTNITNESTLVENMKNGEKECLLYLPLYDETKHLEIGIEKECYIIPQPTPFKKKIIMYGSSILQGASASRPGMAYPSRLSRNTGLEFINLGVSGNAKMEKEVADMIASLHADAYILDCVPNSSPEQIATRTAYLVKSIRKRHPEAPIIMIGGIKRETGNFNLNVRERVHSQNKNFKIEYQKLKNNGVKNLFFIDGDFLLGEDHEGTIDGTHPNDIGFERILQIIEPEIMTILKSVWKI